MEIVYLKAVDSTHKYLQNHISTKGYQKPLAVVTQNQTDGIGSRDNQWIGYEGNLFFSFVVDKTFLPEDLPMQSYSIYFSFILKELLSEFGSSVWLKWPNDFYIEDKKIGGTITTMKNEFIYCGIGLNLLKTNNEYSSIDINIDVQELLIKYFMIIEEKKSWKQIFSKFSIEFDKSREFKTTIKNKKVSLKEAVLHTDGSISVANKKVFSLR